MFKKVENTSFLGRIILEDLLHQIRFFSVLFYLTQLVLAQDRTTDAHHRTQNPALDSGMCAAVAWETCDLVYLG